MSHFGPFASVVGLVGRSVHQTDFQIRDRPQVSAYRLWGHRNLNDAYGDPNAADANTDSKVDGAGAALIVEVQAGTLFRSASIVKRKQGLIEESNRGSTRILLDMDDFVSDPATDLPSDDEVLYVRIQEKPLSTGAFNVVGAGLINAGIPILGPIYVVPPIGAWAMSSPPISIQGTAPANSGSVAGAVPLLNVDGQRANPMHIVFPRYTKNCRILNRSADTALLMAFGLGESMASLGPGEDITLYGAIKEIAFTSADNTGANAKAVPFTLQATIAMGDST